MGWRLRRDVVPGGTSGMHKTSTNVSLVGRLSYAYLAFSHIPFSVHLEKVLSCSIGFPQLPPGVIRGLQNLARLAMISDGEFLATLLLGASVCREIQDYDTNC